MATKYFALLTNIGAAKLANATALGAQVEITQMAVGDGNGALPTPNPAQTALVHELRRAHLNMLTVDPVNTNQIIAEQVIPEDAGGWWIREIGLFDKDGDMIAVANCAETYKPQLQEGSGRVQVIRVILIVSSTEAVTLKIDPSVVLATRKYVDDAVIEVKAYADDLMKKHVDATNPHKQYPLIANALKEMVDAGLVNQILQNLGLGDSDGFVGRLLAPPMRLTASGEYTPSPEAKYALVELQAAGGNGGNAPATGSGVVGIAVGGSAGGYAKFLVKISDITNFNYTIGVHASSSNSATAGGSSSFCGVTCAGGTGSTLAGTSSGSSPVQSRGLLGGNVTNAGTTPLTLIESIQGDTSGNALYTSPGNSVSGNGASSRFAPGPIGIGGSSGSGINAKDGAGGSGANSTNNPGGGFTGGLGGDGLMILWELA